MPKEKQKTTGDKGSIFGAALILTELGYWFFPPRPFIFNERA